MPLFTVGYNRGADKTKSLDTIFSGVTGVESVKVRKSGRVAEIEISDEHLAAVKEYATQNGCIVENKSTMSPNI